MRFLIIAYFLLLNIFSASSTRFYIKLSEIMCFGKFHVIYTPGLKYVRLLWDYSVIKKLSQGHQRMLYFDLNDFYI